jgi:hypothetical protein
MCQPLFRSLRQQTPIKSRKLATINVWLLKHATYLQQKRFKRKQTQQYNNKILLLFWFGAFARGNNASTSENCAAPTKREKACFYTITTTKRTSVSHEVNRSFLHATVLHERRNEKDLAIALFATLSIYIHNLATMKNEFLLIYRRTAAV